MQVEVKDDIDGAIRILKKTLEKEGIFREIKMREQSPNKGDRRKAKQRIAGQRRRELERKKELREHGHNRIR